jgi:DUF971 family protein
MQQIIPTRLNLKKDEKLEIEWSDGQKSVYSIDTLRSMCPCASCREVRAEQQKKKSLLNILPGNYSSKIAVTSAELVGNYALKLQFSDQHDTGIFSFEYLRQLSGQS